MLIKSADDKSRRIALLNELQHSTQLDANQKRWLREELERIRAGTQGERDAAHYINNWRKDSNTHAVLHDLRIVVDGETAQIDHLAINRALHFYLFETKCFNGHLQINERGEFSVRYGSGKAFGVPSPIEQSRRHERVLIKLLDRLEITGRAGMKPTFHHVVLLHPKAIISRPAESDFDTRDVIKADQIATWHAEYIDKRFGLGSMLGMLANMHGADTLQAWAEKLARQHRPQDPLVMPDFMLPKAAAPTPEAAPAPASPPAGDSHPLHRKLICATCNAKISFPEGKFCWNNAARFGGLQYCREHQQTMR